jgi:hypothetical protein
MLAQAMTGRWIYTAWRGQRAPSLIDLDADPLAETNVLEGNADVAKHLHGEIVQFMRRQNISQEFIAEYLGAGTS